MTTTYRRDIEKVAADGLWPSGIIELDPEQDVRHYAIAVVLCHMPDLDYASLVDKIDSFEWFIPHAAVLGMVYPFFVTVTDHPKWRDHARVLYLSPALEEKSQDVAIATIAHELAHIVLDHELIAGNDDYSVQEDAAGNVSGSGALANRLQRRSRDIKGARLTRPLSLTSFAKSTKSRVSNDSGTTDNRTPGR